MQLNRKLLQFYSTNLINILIALLLLLYQARALYGSIVFLSISGITCFLCPLLTVKYKKTIRKIYFQYIILISVSLQVLYCCFLNQDLLKLGYVLLKVQELQIVKKLSIFQTVIASISYNICALGLLIYWKEDALQYIAILYGSLHILKKKELQSDNVELPSHYTKPSLTKRNSENVNLIQDSISNSWMMRLQHIPVGIMVVKKENLQVIFVNHSLLKMFEDNENVTKFVMEELSFKLAVKRRRKQVKETSIRLPLKSSPKQASVPMFFSYSKVQSVQKLPVTLKDILQELQNGNLEQYYSKDNNIELLVQISKGKRSFPEDDEQRSIQCKIFCGQNDTEYLIIMDDISLQSYLQKLETREKFQVRIIDSFSHELRTPLNSAKLFLDALSNDDRISEHHKINYIIPASNALKLQAYLIRDIIDFTQFLTHVIKYNFEEFYFENIVQEINDIFKPMCYLKNLGLHINVKNAVPLMLNNDFDRIMQILINLISNSIKFSEKGLIQIEISCYENILTFCIKDHGVGIDHEQLSKIQIFLKSFNEHRDFTSHDEWQGLGLLVSQMNLLKLAPQNRTYLRIHSTGIGEGTTATFKIKATQSTNTILLGGTTIKRCSLKCAFTVPDLGYGIQGILIISNPKYDRFAEEELIQQIPIRHHSSVAHYFRPQQSTGLINQDLQQETDLLQNEDIEQGNPCDNLVKLNSNSKHFPLFQIGERDKSSKKRKQSSFNLSELESPSSHRPNTLISRLIQREEQEIQMEERFENIQFSCRCARVLSVDDDSFNQRALQVIIGQMGLRLILAFNGAQAIDIIQKTEKCSESCKLFHFILMDCQMPVIDGWTATKTLVEMMRQQTIPVIPVIGLTAFNSEEDLKRCLDVGMREVLIKPLNLNELKQVLLKLFN